MERRTVRRVKRRITCDFSHEDRAYKGIVLDLDHAGMFVRTNATLRPGVEIDIHLAACTTASAMTVRARVVRRRSVPANLRSLINPGLGVQILEAPREYGLIFGSEKLSSAIGSNSTHVTPTPDTACTSDRTQPEPAEEVVDQKSPPVTRPESVPTANSSDSGVRATHRSTHSSTGQTSSHQVTGPGTQAPSPKPLPQATAVLVGGDELDEIADVLVEFGVESIYREPTDPQLQIIGEVRLLIVSARLAISHAIPVGGAATVSVAVCDEVSGTMRTMLRKQGFEYLICQPVHIEALRLLVQYALFDQPDRRSRARLPFGYEVSWRMGWRRDTGELLDISIEGCRLLVSDGMPLDSRVHIKIPSEVGGGQPLKVSGSVTRSSRYKTSDGLDCYAVGMIFDELPSKISEQLDRFCGLWTGTLPVMLNGDSAASSCSKSEAVSEASVVQEPAREEVVDEERRDENQADAENDSAPADRRQSPRGQLNREIVQVDTEQRVIQALLGRDLSMDGIRIDSQFGINSGDKLQIALFDAARGEALVLHTVVAKADGGVGIVLRFVDLSAENEEHLGAIIAALPAVESLGMPRGSTVVPAGILSEDGTAATE